MRILMISLDKGLLGQDEMGNVVSRHWEYGQYAEKLDIIVFSRPGYTQNKISEKVRAFPTNSKTKFNYLFDAYKIGHGLFKENYYQLVVTQAPFISGLVGYWLAKKFRVKLLIHFHGDYIGNKEWLKEKWYNFLMVPIAKFLAKRADGVRVMSGGVKEKLIQAGISPNKIRVISTPVSLIKFRQGDQNKVTQLKNKYSNKKIILFIGRLEKVKDLPTLLRALEEVKKTCQNFILLVIGQGSLLRDWQKMTKKLDLEKEVIFLGQINHAELPNYYEVSEFLVNSSRSESFGKVLVEAASMGRPAVATLTTGAQEIIIGGQTGLLSPVKDSPALANNIFKLLNNEELTKKLGQAARELVTQRFDGGLKTKEIIQFWRDLVK